MTGLLALQDLELRTVPDLLDRSGAAFGYDRPFYIEVATGERLSYGAFLSRVAGAADWLAARFAPGTVIAVMLSNRIEYFILRFALSTAGLVEAAINGEHKGEILKRMLDIAAPAAIFLEERFSENLENCGRALGDAVLYREDALGEVTGLTLDWARRPRPEIAPGDPCRIIYTSGTTGGSKGAELSHAYEVFAGYGYSQWIGLSERDTWLYVTPFFHIDAVCIAATALHHGGGFALAPKFSASRFWDQAGAAGATTFLYVGTILAILLKGEGPAGDTSIRTAIGGGCPGPLWERFEGRFDIPIIELFGMTECIAATINHHRNRRPGSVGQVLEGYEIAILDSLDRPLPPGERGEIAIRGREPYALMSGYRGDPEATRSKMRNSWFHTGDRGSFDEDGFMYYHGRMKDVIRVRGENVDAAELETVVDAFRGVLYSAAIAAPSDLGDDELMLYVQAKPGEEVAPDALARYLESSVAPFMVPRYIKLVENLPLTPTEKVIKAELSPEIDAATWRRPER